MIVSNFVYFVDTNVIRHHYSKVIKNFKNYPVIIPTTVFYEILNFCRHNSKTKGIEKFLLFMNPVFSHNGIYYMPNSYLYKLFNQEIDFEEFYNRLTLEMKNNLSNILSNFMCLIFINHFKKESFLTYVNDESVSQFLHKIIKRKIDKIIDEDFLITLNIKDYLNKELFNKLLVVIENSYEKWVKSLNQTISKEDFVNLYKIIDNEKYNGSIANGKIFSKEIDLTNIVFDKYDFLNQILIERIRANLLNKDENRIEINNLYDYMISHEYLQFAEQAWKKDITPIFLTVDKNFLLFECLNKVPVIAKLHKYLSISLEHSKKLKEINL